MARPGITYREVSEIATQLIAQGQNPTIERIRLLLGTGSSTTIANHLRQWKVEQTGDDTIRSKEQVPYELNAIVKGLWEKIVSQSDEKIQNIEENYQQQLGKLQQELQKYKSNNQRWQQLYAQWIEEKKQLTTQKHELNHKIHTIEDEVTSTKGKLENAFQQIQEKQERIAELNRLHQQAQHNLELYRESAREQSLIAQQQFDQQKQELQLRLKHLKEEMTITKEQALSMQQALQTIQQSHADLEKNYVKAQTVIEEQQQSLLTSEKIKTEYAQSSAHWEKMYNDAQQMIETKTLQLIDSQSEVKSLSHQLNSTNQSLKDIEKQNKELEHINWKLARELELEKENITLLKSGNNKRISQRKRVVE